MKENPAKPKTGTWIVRQVPADLMRQARMAALAQGKTVRELLLDLMRNHVQDLKARGVLAK